ncbi:MAG: SUMF1/EgtB/PvdO family nonheme iron enzyme [Chloroflexi bacterium]|nr:SUMF1/EgtB/PvdO family nonheme iron enzyme [Chloroflexota bacterium]
MRLFVSYARVDKPYCIEIMETLEAHEIWYDQRLYAGQHWWKEILRRLDWCEGFVYLLSPDSVNSQYCKQEYELACNLGRHIFPVMIREVPNLPQFLGDLQYVDFTKGINSEAVKNLLNAIYLADHEHQPNARVSSIRTEMVKQQQVNPATVIRIAANAMENGQYDQAVFLLRQAKANGFKSRFINLDALLQEAETALERQTYLIEAEREYRQIAELLKHKRTNRLGWEAFEAFRRDFPDYDPDKLAEKYGTKAFAAAAAPVSRPPAMTLTLPEPPALADVFTLPLLEWCNIPAGVVELLDVDKNGQRVSAKVTVEPFQISRFPVTNKQFQAFLDDPMGYANPAWWQYHPQAYAWREKNPEAKACRFKGDERPREMVTWYEAVAFCQWLTARMGCSIALPTTAQWQRAFQGDDARAYPWGNNFDKANCNTAESNLKMTTLVTRYPGGVSPYGVFDMAGNVWEWCLDSPVNGGDNGSSAASHKRFVRGGSYISPYQRAHVAFKYSLTPETFHNSIGFRIVCNR